MKKGLKIAAGAAAALLVLGGAGLYLSQTLFKWKKIEYEIMPVFSDGTYSYLTEPYPYADIEVPESFKECSIKGIDFEAPEGLDWMYPLETEGIKSGIIVDNADVSKRNLLICVEDKETSGIRVEDFEFFFDKRTLRGMKKLGLEKPENTHDLMFLCETFDYKKCNKFSPSEVSAAYNIMMLKGILVPAGMSMDLSDRKVDLGEEIENKRYWYDTDRMRSFIQQGTAENGSYELVLEVCSPDDPNSYQMVMIIGNDIDTVRQIAKTVTIAEDAE